MGMEFRGFAKKKKGVWSEKRREEREVRTLFASVIVTVSGKVYPLLLLLLQL